MSAPKRLHRLVVAAYPPSFRHRYGDELGALASDGDRGWRDSVDLVAGMCRAWVAPVFGGTPEEQRRRRLEATTITVLVAWCASLLAAAGFAKAVDDPPLGALHGAAWAAFATGAVTLQVTAAVVLASGFGFWLLVVVPAWRSSRHDIVARALVPGVIAALWLGVTALVGLYARGELPRGSAPGAPPAGGLPNVIFVAWLGVTLLCAAGCATGASLALRRARLSEPRLSVSAAVAAVAAVGITIQTVAVVVCLTSVLRSGAILGSRDALFAFGSAAVLVAATVVAALAAARGVAVLRLGPPTPLRESA